MAVSDRRRHKRAHTAAMHAEDLGPNCAQLSGHISDVRHAAANGRAAQPLDDSDTAESAGASADEHVDRAADDDDADAEPSDSAESAGPSGDDEPGNEEPVAPGSHRSNSNAVLDVGQTSSGRKRKRRAETAVDAASEGSGRVDEDDTAFSDGEEAPLMSPEGVAAATAGLEEPSSEDDDEEEEDAEGGRGKPAWAGMLGEAGDSGDDSDAEHDGPAVAAGGGDDQDAGAFKSSAKGAAVARAFARIMEKTRPDDRGLSILSKSRSVAKRKRDEKAERTVDMEARQLRQEMKRRGHIIIPKRGEDPEQDAAEKALMKVATRGVVRLFNAVSKAQKQNLEESIVGKRAKGATLSKARFLAELQGGTGTAAGGTANAGSGVGGKLAVPIGGFSAGASAVSAAAAAAAQDDTHSTWEVLKDDYTGLQAGSKMKDWDKREDSDDAPAQETFDDPVQSDSDVGAW